MDGLQDGCAGAKVRPTPARVTLRRAFGSSLNPAIIRAMGEGTTIQKTVTLMDQLGFYLPENHRSTPVATSVALGRYAGRPRAVHWLAAVAMQAARGKTGPVNAPYFVERYRLIEPLANGDFTFRQETPARASFELEEPVSADGAAFLRAVLSEPVCDAKEGTLRRLNAWCAAARKDVRVHVAKTGTVPVRTIGGTFDESDWWIAGGIEFEDGRAYSYVISLGAGSPRGAFARGLGAGRWHRWRMCCCRISWRTDVKFPWQNDSGERPSSAGGGVQAGAAIDATARQMSRMAAAARALPIFASIPVFSLAVFITISFIGTYTGMLQVLKSGDNSFGILGVVGVFLFIFATTLIMAYSVSEVFRSGRSFWPRMSLVATYIVTLLISVSFGFAFYWTQLEARLQAVGDAERFLTVFDREITVADTQLAATLTTLTTLNTNFTALSAAERASGNQCGEVSGGGDGPRTRHLAARAGEINALVMALTPQIEAVRAEAETVRGQIEQVRALGAKTASQVTPAEREQVFRSAAGAANKAGATLEALATSQSVKNYTADLRTWSAEYANPSLTRVEAGTGNRFKCYNTTIASQLNGVASDLAALPILPISDLDAYAGAAATREALDRFWYTLTGPVRGIIDGPRTQTETEREDAAPRGDPRSAGAAGRRGASGGDVEPRGETAGGGAAGPAPR